MSELVRQISVLLLALTFAVGTAPHGMQMSQASDMGLAMISAAGGDAPMSGKCDGCGGDQKGTAPAACFAFCAGFIALPVAAIAFDPVPAKIVRYAAPQRASGRNEPPDPYPPRSTILS